MKEDRAAARLLDRCEKSESLVTLPTTLKTKRIIFLLEGGMTQSQRHAWTVQRSTCHELETQASKVHESRDIPILYIRI